MLVVVGWLVFGWWRALGWSAFFPFLLYTSTLEVSVPGMRVG